jgi:hypothetical protein
VIGNIDTHYTKKQVHFPESKEKLINGLHCNEEYRIVWILIYVGL